MFAKVSYMAVVRHLHLYEWQLICGKADF